MFVMITQSYAVCLLVVSIPQVGQKKKIKLETEDNISLTPTSSEFHRRKRNKHARVLAARQSPMKRMTGILTIVLTQKATNLYFFSRFPLKQPHLHSILSKYWTDKGII